ncbi:hypothetical protein PVK06_030157 [Gossypium arboreum]|uniref:Uncharacterized protein n=1 Tax=Gossypium arboreum TaxID=29729 RepID=A0ABR0NMJ5_GOSAR|nr:hypothetical protein PVK06_030157 [Gossypium arboreum]
MRRFLWTLWAVSLGITTLTLGLGSDMMSVGTRRRRSAMSSLAYGLIMRATSWISWHWFERSWVLGNISTIKG